VVVSVDMAVPSTPALVVEARSQRHELM